MRGYGLSGVLLLIGIALVSAATAVGYSDLRLLLAGETVDARILSYEQGGAGEQYDSGALQVTVRYRAPSPGDQSFTTGVAVSDLSTRTRIKEGETSVLSILVDPQDPTKACPAGEISEWILIAGVLGGIGLLFTLIGVLVLVGTLNPAFGDNLGLVIGGGVALLTLAGLWAGGVYLLYDDHVKANLWPQIDGRVVEVGVVEGLRRDTNSHRSYKVYSPKVLYRFAVDGRTYVGEGPSDLTTTSTDRDWAEGVAARYAVGQTVPVHYDPEDPAHSALEIQSGFLGWIFLGAASVVSVLLLVAWRVFGKRRPG